MKLDKICRTCLLEKSNLKPLFGACVANMLMSFSSIQVIEGDGLPEQICIQCLQMVNRSYSFKQLCEKSDNSLREYISNLRIQVSMENNHNLINDVKTDQLFTSNEVLQHSSIFQEIFNDATSNSLVDNFSNQNTNNVVSDLAETMQSLQTIAEQYLPETWETDNEIVSCQSNSQETNCSTYNLEGYLKCQFCEDIFKDEWNLGEHIKIHTGQTKYFCSICGISFNNSQSLNSHMIEHSLTKNNSENETKTSNSNLLCNICDQIFENENFLQKHLKDIHFNSLNDLESKYNCNICDKRFKQNKLYIIHMRRHTGERPLKCDICTKSFSLPSSLLKHKNTHTEKKFICTVCGTKFSQSSNLNSHLRTHTGEKPFVCNICGKYFSTLISRNVHLRIHTGDKPFKCSTCGYSSITNSQLKKHIMKHTGEKPYHCWQCGKSFRHKDTRDTHIRYHTGERPYACSFCSKKYIAASHLRVHMNSHKDNRKFYCDICMRKFLDSKTLNSHILTHTGVKPYSCNYCNMKFTQSSTLKNHIKNIHKIK